MKKKNDKKLSPIRFGFIVIFVAFMINALLGTILLILFIYYLAKNSKSLLFRIDILQRMAQQKYDSGDGQTVTDSQEVREFLQNDRSILSKGILSVLPRSNRLQKRKRYLHIALNNTLAEAEDIISRLPTSDRILVEVGTPMIKMYGTSAVSTVKSMVPSGTYIVADNKCADLAEREVQLMAGAGANASTCLGVAPLETIDRFIEECSRLGIDSMIDMMNVESAVNVLDRLKKLPDVVILHRGVDETEFSKEKVIPFYQIKQIKGKYNILVAVAGGDTIKEVQRSIFNGADIVVVWKNFYQANQDTAILAESFLKEIK